MKKLNNKYRNNNNSNNQIYSLNYKFDSISSAGKICGTALDLIKRYNELAKEAHGNGNYVEAEVFRQYAEHYRKIVTEINEKKNQRLQFSRENENNTASAEPSSVDAKDETVQPEKTEIPAETLQPETAPAKREFKIIEISASEADTAASAAAPAGGKPVRTRRKAAAEAAAL